MKTHGGGSQNPKSSIALITAVIATVPAMYDGDWMPWLRLNVTLALLTTVIVVVAMSMRDRQQ